jgi:hypothetical protein
MRLDRRLDEADAAKDSEAVGAIGYMPTLRAMSPSPTTPGIVSTDSTNRPLPGSAAPATTAEQ